MLNPLTPHERYLFHQIHPLKLATDVVSGFGSLVPLWRHQLGPAFAVMLIPPIIASGLVLRFASLERQRDSAFGRYVARTMTRAVEGVRLAGMVVMAVGAWQRSALVIVGGLSIVVLGWTRGLFKPTRDG